MYNKVVLVGRIGTDSIYKGTQRPKAIFPLSTEKTWKKKTHGERQTKKLWHKIIVSGQLLKSCKGRLVKNKMILVEGELRSSAQQTSQESGLGHYIFTNEVFALQIKFI